MNKFYLIILFTISSVFSYAQQNFQPGYIITLTNEKIEGLINDLDWRVNPDVIQFRKNTESASTEYTALSINEFGVGNRRYWGRVVTLDQSAEKSDDLLLGVDAIKKEIDTVFVEVLVEGQITLLYSMSKNRKAHYLYEVNGKTEELIVKRTIINKLDAMGNNAGKEVATTDIYKGQLKSLMQDCSSISSTIEKTRLTTNDLQKLFIKYLSCIGDKYTVEENTNKSVVNWGIMAGVFFSSLKFEPEIYSGKFNASGIPVGISADVVLAKNRGKLSVYNELFYNGYTYENNSNTFFDFSYLRYNSMFRISSIEKSNIRFFGNAGIGFGFVLKGEVPFDDFRKNDYTAHLGAGIKYKVISLEARYERTTGFSKFIDINDRIQSFYFLVNWQLTHKKNQQ